jgi:hypothetical protein
LVAASPGQPVRGRPGGGGRSTKAASRPGDLWGGQRDHAGVGWERLTGPDRERAWAPVPGLCKAAVMAQMAAAAMTGTVCRAMAVYSRTWDSSSPKQSFSQRNCSSTGHLSPLARIRRSASAAAVPGPSSCERPAHRSYGDGGSAGDGAVRRPPATTRHKQAYATPHPPGSADRLLAGQRWCHLPGPRPAGSSVRLLDLSPATTLTARGRNAQAYRTSGHA